jgi:uncharacterized membrane protein YgcG
VGLVALAAPASADVNDFSFESMDVQYYLGQDADGHSTLRTVETFVALFPDVDQNHGMLREIPLSYGGTSVDDPTRVETDVHVTSVTMNGKAHSFDTSENYGFLDVAIRSADYVHGPTTYVIDYTQKYVARAFPDTHDDEFYWDVNGTGWAQDFGTVSASIHLSPALQAKATGQNACYFGNEGSVAKCDVTAIDDGFAVTQTDVAAYQNVTVALGFPLGTFTAGPKVEDHWIVKILPWVLLGILALIVVLIVTLRRTRWRHAPGRGIVVPQYEGPVDLGVLPAATFLGTPQRGLPAEFVNLAVTGIARLIEDPDQPESKRFRLDLLDRRLATETDDDTAVRKLFGKNLDTVSVVLDRNNRKLGDRIASLVSMSAGIPSDRKLVEKKTSKITKWLRWPAFACFAVSWFIVFWASNQGVENGLLTLQLIVTIVGSLVVIGFGGVPERRTQLGSETLEHLQGLRDYLQLAEADRLRVLQSPQGAQRTRVDPNDNAQVVKLYEKLLPWAMVWGVEDQWGKVLGDKYATTDLQPTNLQFTSGIVGLSAFATSSMASSFSQTVTSSSSSSSWSRSGSSSSFGGSSGGGFSGGGGGGGGGGGL